MSEKKEKSFDTNLKNKTTKNWSKFMPGPEGPTGAA